MLLLVVAPPGPLLSLLSDEKMVDLGCNFGVGNCWCCCCTCFTFAMGVVVVVWVVDVIVKLVELSFAISTLGEGL